MFEPYILARARWKKRLVHWFFEDANFQHVCLWRALTAKEADQIRKCGINAPIVVAPNGLNPAEYPTPEKRAEWIPTPRVPRLTKVRPRLLFLSRIHPKKGLDLLLTAWAGQSYKDWELVIAGPDEQGYLTAMERLAASLGIRDQVVFTGAVTGQTKIDLLYSADLFSLPSYSEGLPMSLLEAMACGVPVLATKQCNCPDVELSGAGWLCDPDLDSLVKALSVALNVAESERRQRGAAGRRLVERSFAWPKVASEILSACAAHCS